MVLIDPAPDTDAILQTEAQFAARQTVTLSFDSDDAALSKRFTYAPRLRLVLAGRGAIFRHMAQVGHAMGFDVRLLAPDAEDLAAIGHLSSAAAIHLTTPNAAPTLDMLDAHSAFLTLCHDHDWEPSFLRAALEMPLHFIGSLGSRRTHDMRCGTLRQLEVSEASLARLNGPIGLVPSLRDASSTAASALAEIVAVFQKKATPFEALSE